MKNLLRYIVPFSIDDDRYDEIVSELKEKSVCEQKKEYKWNEKSLISGDSDLLKFLIDSVGNDSEKKNIGISFTLEYKNNPYTKAWKWKHNDINEIDFKTKNLRLIIFRTGICFLCYDADINSKCTDDVIETFQYKFKELGYSSSNDFFVNEKIFDENGKFKENVLLPLTPGEWVIWAVLQYMQ